MSDQLLMQAIFAAWHDQIAAAVKDRPVPAELLAALVANESVGQETATRFEPAVFLELCEVLAGKRAVYNPPGIRRPLSAADLLPFAIPQSTRISLTSYGTQFSLEKSFTDSMHYVAELATSYGVLQIMGWHWLEFERPFPSPPPTIAEELAFGVEILVYFASRYTLDLSSDFEKVFRCWNTGRPDGQTFDPAYVPNGLHRLTLYALTAKPATAESAT